MWQKIVRCLTGYIHHNRYLSLFIIYFLYLRSLAVVNIFAIAKNRNLQNVGGSTLEVFLENSLEDGLENAPKDALEETLENS